MTTAELEANGILDGEDIRDSLAGYDILIGNGFSINLSKNLAYNSIYDIFKEYCSKELIDVFTEFRTTNFEYIMEVLKNTMSVNKTFRKDFQFIEPLMEELKMGLIKTITNTHPQYKDISPDIFRSLAYELKDFEDIYTTNYDVFLYKILLESNRLVEMGFLSSKIIQDDFFESAGKHKLTIGGWDNDSRRIFYLHGALFLYHQNYTYKFRVGGENDEYIIMLRNEIQHGNVPLFVAEGTFLDKEIAIQNNYYLRTCLSKLRYSKKDLVVFGLSFQSSDRHIVEAINKSHIKTLVVGVYPENKDEKDIIAETSRMNAMFPNKSVSFYDSRTLFNFHPKYRY